MVGGELIASRTMALYMVYESYHGRAAVRYVGLCAARDLNTAFHIALG